MLEKAESTQQHISSTIKSSNKIASDEGLSTREFVQKSNKLVSDHFRLCESTFVDSVANIKNDLVDIKACYREIKVEQLNLQSQIKQIADTLAGQIKDSRLGTLKSLNDLSSIMKDYQSRTEAALNNFKNDIIQTVATALKSTQDLIRQNIDLNPLQQSLATEMGSLTEKIESLNRQFCNSINHSTQEVTNQTREAVLSKIESLSSTFSNRFNTIDKLAEQLTQQNSHLQQQQQLQTEQSVRQACLDQLDKQFKRQQQNFELVLKDKQASVRQACLDQLDKQFKQQQEHLELVLKDNQASVRQAWVDQLDKQFEHQQQHFDNLLLDNRTVASQLQSAQSKLDQFISSTIASSTSSSSGSHNRGASYLDVDKSVRPVSSSNAKKINTLNTTNILSHEDIKTSLQAGNKRNYPTDASTEFYHGSGKTDDFRQPKQQRQQQSNERGNQIHLFNRQLSSNDAEDSDNQSELEDNPTVISSSSSIFSESKNQQMQYARVNRQYEEMASTLQSSCSIVREQSQKGNAAGGKDARHRCAVHHNVRTPFVCKTHALNLCGVCLYNHKNEYPVTTPNRSNRRVSVHRSTGSRDVDVVAFDSESDESADSSSGSGVDSRLSSNASDNDYSGNSKWKRH